MTAPARCLLVALAPSCLLALAACQPLSPGERTELPPGPAPVERGVETDLDLARAVDEAVLSFLSPGDVTGISVALVADGEVVFTSGYGWAELDGAQPLSANTPVLLSSVSKTFIGVAAMQAVERGRLQLDDSLTDRVGFTVDNPRVDGETITLRHALTHNTGLRDTREYDRSYDEGDPTIELSEFVQGYVQPRGKYWRRRNWRKAAPGTEFAYSNVGASLGALAIASAQDDEFMTLVQRTIFEPLGMEDSAYLLNDLPREAAVPYKHTVVGDDFRPWPQYGYPTYPDGMIRSSANDMGRYLAAIEGGGQLEGVELLSADSVDEMLTVDASAGTDEDGQAIAWAMREMDGRELYGHNGGDFGSTTEIWIDRDAHVGIAVLLNCDTTSESWDRLMALERELLDLAETTG
ncbi:MAG: serine hydrolase domain-containing protein [Myxococcota bacterium]